MFCVVRVWVGLGQMRWKERKKVLIIIHYYCLTREISNVVWDTRRCNEYFVFHGAEFRVCDELTAKPTRDENERRMKDNNGGKVDRVLVTYYCLP